MADYTKLDNFEDQRAAAVLTLTQHLRYFLHEFDSGCDIGTFDPPRLSLDVLLNLRITTLPQVDILAHLNPNFLDYSHKNNINNGLLLQTADLDIDFAAQTPSEAEIEEFEPFYENRYRNHYQRVFYFEKLLGQSRSVLPRSSHSRKDIDRWRPSPAPRRSNSAKASEQIPDPRGINHQRHRHQATRELKPRPYFLQGDEERFMFSLRFEQWLVVNDSYLDLEPFSLSFYLSKPGQVDEQYARMVASAWTVWDRSVLHFMQESGFPMEASSTIRNYLAETDFMTRVQRGLARPEQIELITMVLEAFMRDFEEFLQLSSKGSESMNPVEQVTSKLDLSDLYSITSELDRYRTYCSVSNLKHPSVLGPRSIPAKVIIILRDMWNSKGTCTFVEFIRTGWQRVGLVEFLTELRCESIEARIMKYVREE